MQGRVSNPPLHRRDRLDFRLRGNDGRGNSDGPGHAAPDPAGRTFVLRLVVTEEQARESTSRRDTLYGALRFPLGLEAYPASVQALHLIS